VRRGICRPCGKTFTILPHWLVPAAPFTLRCRQLACERLAAGDSADQAAPDCQDLSRSPDPSTLRRWARRRMFSVCCWLRLGTLGKCFDRNVALMAHLASVYFRAALKRNPCFETKGRMLRTHTPEHEFD
jgi:hypothetical protein